MRLRSLAFPSALLFLACEAACESPQQTVPPPENVGEAQEAFTNVCPGAATVSGIDIASFQHPNGAGINWGQVATAEKYVIIKATQGTGYTNAYYAGDASGARGAGLVVGAYHFLAPSSQSGESGTAQADYFASKANVQANDMPPMLDLEASSLYNNVLPSVGDVTSFLTEVEAKTGRKPFVYVGYYTLQSLGNPSQLASYLIDVPAYGACPNFPNNYPIQNLIIWQNSSTTAVPGISGNVDHDVFYGDMAAFNAFAHPMDPLPTGYLDHVGCDTVNGWGQDPDNKAASINVDVYYNGPAGGPGVTGIRLDANISRPDLCTALGSCNHAFSMRWPRSLFDAKPHDVHAYAIDLTGGPNAELNQSPATGTCPALDPPTGQVKRWITDPATFTAWKFDAFRDIAPMDPAKLAAVPDGANVSAPPQCDQADDGTPEVWVIDQGLRRHVVNPDSLAAWRFTVAKTPAAQVYANPVGPDWPLTPDLAQGSDPKVYAFDVPIPMPTGSTSSTGASTGTGSSGTLSGGTGGSGANGSGAGAGGSGAGGGGNGGPLSKSTCHCTLAGDDASSGGLSLVAIGVAFAFGRRRRRLTR